MEALQALVAPGTPEGFLPVFWAAAAVTWGGNQALIQTGGWSASASSRILSQVHAFVVSYLVLVTFVPAFGGYWLLDATPAQVGMWTDMDVPQWSHAWLLPAITCGYMLGDFVMVLGYEEIRDVPTVVHHIAVLTAFYATLHSGFGIILQAAADCNEMSSVFLNSHWCVSYYKARPQEGPPALAEHWGTLRATNGVFFWLSFTAVRLVGNSIVTYALLHAASEALPVTWLGPAMCLLNFCALHVLNAMWWVQLSKGLLKALGCGPAQQERPKTQ